MTDNPHDMTELLGGESPLCACHTLRKAARAVTQFYDQALRPAGLRVTQFTVLVTAARTGTATMTELAEALVMDRTTLTRNLKPLRARGLVESVAGEDRREKHIAITPKGREAMQRAAPAWREAQATIAGRLGDTRWSRLARDLGETTRLAQGA